MSIRSRSRWRRCRHHAARIRQLRLSLLPGRERAVAEAARPVRRSPALRVPAPADDRQRLRSCAAELVDGARRTAILGCHVALMTRSDALTEEELRAVAADLGVIREANLHRPMPARACERVDADIASARPAASHSRRRSSSTAAATRRLGRGIARRSDARLARASLRAAALDFASWAPSPASRCSLMTILAVALTNSTLGAGLHAFWEAPPRPSIRRAHSFAMPLIDWINHGTPTVFFLVVGLEIKREFTVGHLAVAALRRCPLQRRSVAW